MKSLKEFCDKVIAAERGDSSHDYLKYHKVRFNYVFEMCKRFSVNRDAKILDVGKSYLSTLLATYFNSVDTIGFAPSDDKYLKSKGIDIREERTTTCQHITYDLNRAAFGESISTECRYDLIVFAETIEHLYHAPEFALLALREILSEDGLIICQTPNAVALHKRIKLIAGFNPFELIRYDPSNPGHIREYTKSELISIGNRVGLTAIHHQYRDYFGFNGGALKIILTYLLKVSCLLFPSFSRGQTVVFKKAQVANK